MFSHNIGKLGIMFQDRRHAGKLLAEHLQYVKHMPDVLILGLPRGGIPVAYEVALALEAPLDALLVRKLGVPGQEELAMGAITQGGPVYINKEIVNDLQIRESEIQAAIHRERITLNERNSLYRQGRDAPDMTSKIIVIIDDGLATGATMHAAISLIRLHAPHYIIVAVPVAPRETYEKLSNMVDAVVCLHTPVVFYGVGSFYEDFSQTTDEEVCQLLSDPQLLKF